jgi:glycosyltransferase involved in cell wall biosynthesis
MTSAVCVIVKNEVRDLAEWVIHHHSLGFDRVILYDNDSIDGTYELAVELSHLIPMEVIRWPKFDKENCQVTAYNDCLRRFRDSYEWIAFFDVDEFLIPASDQRVPDLLSEFEDSGGFVINWLMFGSNGLKAPTDLVMSDYTRRAADRFPPNRNVKSIIRPNRAIADCNNPHWFSISGIYENLAHKEIVWSSAQRGIVDVGSIIQAEWRLHHYYTRSRWHWANRVARRQASGRQLSWDAFRDHDRNDVLDISAVSYAADVREQIARLGLNPILEVAYQKINFDNEE